MPLLLVLTLACMASVGMWVRSFRYEDRWVRATSVGGIGIEVVSKVGGVMFSCERSRRARRSVFHSARFHELPASYRYDDYLQEPFRPGEKALPIWDDVMYSQIRLGFAWETEPAGSRMYRAHYHSRNPIEQAGIAKSKKIKGSRHKVLIPYWFLALLTGAWPVLWFVGRLAHRARPGVCRNCGYDLRATPDRCPECGREPNERAQKPHATSQ